jgi:Leucine-rich repeat (LRR) protein
MPLVILSWPALLLALCLARITASAISTEAMQTLETFYESTGGSQWDNDAIHANRGSRDAAWNFTKLASGDYAHQGEVCDTWVGIYCNSDSEIYRLYMQGGNLQGSIPSELEVLAPSLQRLYLYDNHLTGSLPVSIGSLSNMFRIYLYNNLLTGPVPDLGALTNMQRLYLYENALTGSIPSTLATLTNMERLELYSNWLTSSIPNGLSEGMTALERLYLHDNLLTGPVPLDLLEGQTSLAKLNLRDNQFSGPLPPNLHACTNLDTLYLHGNRFTGPVSPSLAELTKLTVLQLRSNQLTGTIPDFSNCTALTALYLNVNDLTGTIPTTFSIMTQLKGLFLADNGLTGTIPPELSLMVSLENMYFYSNRLTGTIPDISGCTSLRLLQLYNNDLSGTIPGDVMNLPSIEHIYLQINRFMGKVPVVSAGPSALVQLFLFDNQLTGSVPNEIWSLTGLEQLNLGQNQLTGSISNRVGEMSKLSVLNLADNRITGSLPPVMFSNSSLLSVISLCGNLITGSIPSMENVNLSALELQNNMLTSTLPANIAQVTALDTLYVGGNSLIGHLPDFKPLINLYALGLQNNKFTGTVASDSFENAMLLTRVLLFNNNFEGDMSFLDAIPSSSTSELSDGLDLLMVDVSNNAFTGTLSSTLFTKNTALKIFSAAMNCLSGTIPETICDAVDLEVVGLSGLTSGVTCRNPYWDGTAMEGTWNAFSVSNFMSGSLPECVLGLAQLTDVFIDGNDLPADLSDVMLSPSIRKIVLSKNEITGTLPLSFSGLVNAVQIDFSVNRISGGLAEVGSLLTQQNLTVGESLALNLSQNYLSGDIPPQVANLGEVNILSGNVYDCYGSSIPESDPDAGKYQCGSRAINNGLFAFFGLVVVALLAVAMWAITRDSEKIAAFYQQLKVWYARGSGEKKGTDNHGEEENEHVPDRTPMISAAIKALLDLKHMALLIGVACFFSLFVYITLWETGNGAISDEYAWNATSAFQRGVKSGSTQLAFSAALLGFLYYLAFTRRQTKTEKGGGIDSPHHHIVTKKSVEEGAGDGEGHSEDEYPDDRSYFDNAVHLFTLLIIVVLAEMIVTSVNFGYVYALLNFDPSSQTVALYAITLFNIMWGAYGVNYLLAYNSFVRRLIGLDRGRRSFIKWLFGTQGGLLLYLSIIDKIVVPILVFTFISPSCFNGIFESNETTISYSFTDEIVSYSTGPHAGEAMLTRTTDIVTTIMSPFTYRYRCSTSIIAGYSGIFMLQFTQMLVVGLMNLAFLYMMSDELGNPCLSVLPEPCMLGGWKLWLWEQFVIYCVPKLVWTKCHHGLIVAMNKRAVVRGSQSETENTIDTNQIVEEEVFSLELVTIEICSTILIMLTIGTVSPLVSLLASIGLWVHISVRQCMLGAFLGIVSVALKTANEGEVVGDGDVSNASVSDSYGHADILSSINDVYIQLQVDCAKSATTPWKSRFFFSLMFICVHTAFVCDIYASLALSYVPFAVFGGLVVVCEMSCRYMKCDRGNSGGIGSERGNKSEGKEGSGADQSTLASGGGSVDDVELEMTVNPFMDGRSASEVIEPDMVMNPMYPKNDESAETDVIPVLMV